MERKRAAAALVALVTLGVGCRGHGHHPATRIRPPAAMVHVTNTNWLDVTVFAVRGHSRSRIGFVTSLASATFELPAAMVPDGTVRLLIDPIGSEGTYTTDVITIQPGARLELTVMPSLAMSSFAIWPR